jgi:hypothetical protein
MEVLERVFILISENPSGWFTEKTAPKVGAPVPMTAPPTSEAGVCFSSFDEQSCLSSVEQKKVAGSRGTRRLAR